MKAWRVSENGEPASVMMLTEVDVPEPGPHEVLVRVRASALNFPDVLVCRGDYQVRPELPFTPGAEVCGDVVAFGGAAPAGSGISLGERVIGMTVPGKGGFGEYAVMPLSDLTPAPLPLTDAEAAAFFVAYYTGWCGLFRRARLRAGETLLVHAAGGGVGTAAVQLGLSAGARVIGVVGGKDKADVVAGLGADLVIDRHEEDFVAAVNTFTDGHGADVVYDPVGGETYQRSTKCIAFEGRILVVGFAGGDIQSAALNHALVKNYSIVGLHWGLYNTYDPAAVLECHRDLMAMADAGTINPLVSERLALADVAKGVQRLADGVTVGRVVYDPAAGA
jgi:NADPH2:quinone reductase